MQIVRTIKILEKVHKCDWCDRESGSSGSKCSTVNCCSSSIISDDVVMSGVERVKCHSTHVCLCCFMVSCQPDAVMRIVRR
jgi:hypothetical protein